MGSLCIPPSPSHPASPPLTLPPPLSLSPPQTLIGDYLGHHDEAHVAVMHAFIDGIDFTSLSFDAAIRTFLNGFRLPGEAQKIDRIMEKFAEK